jgi:hypothetical protein
MANNLRAGMSENEEVDYHQREYKTSIMVFWAVMPCGLVGLQKRTQTAETHWTAVLMRTPGRLLTTTVTGKVAEEEKLNTLHDPNLSGLRKPSDAPVGLLWILQLCAIM